MGAEVGSAQVSGRGGLGDVHVDDSKRVVVVPGIMNEP